MANPAFSRDESPIFRGGAGQFTFLKPLKVPPPAPAFTVTGAPVYLEQFRGKVILLNFWATWCAPCVKEMPSLDRLQGELGSEAFAVVSVSIDRDGEAAVRPFFERLGLRHLRMYLDRENRMGYLASDGGRRGVFALYALPISYLIDRQGRAIGYLPGPADWTSLEALRFLKYFIHGS